MRPTGKRAAPPTAQWTWSSSGHGARVRPALVVSPVPPVSLTAGAAFTTVEPAMVHERAGWPALERVDRRQADPRTGLFSEELVRLAHQVLDGRAALRRHGPLVCVYNRTGGARLLACAHCGELARCTRCGAAAAKARETELLACPRCGETRPVVCAHCGRLRMKTLRAGVSRLREELAALLGAEVGEVAGPKKGAESEVPSAPVLVGTEAVLHRVRRASAVAFLDIDLHLLAPRLSATEDTLALFVRAGRLVGGRSAGVPSWPRPGPDPGAGPPGARSRGARSAGARAGRGGRSAPDGVAAAVRRAGPPLGCAGLGLCPVAGSGGGRLGLGLGPRPTTASWCAPRTTRHSATSWRPRPGPRAGASGSRSIRPPSERPQRGGWSPPVKWVRCPA